MDQVISRGNRKYHRYRRKLACRNCKARHIRCKTPEATDTVGAHRHIRRCQACIDANEECILEISTAAKHLKASPTTSVNSNQQLRSESHSTLSNLNSAPPGSHSLEAGKQNHPQSQRSETDDGPTTFWLTTDPPQEGSEAFLVRLVDNNDDESSDDTARGAKKVMYFGNDSVWSYSLQKARRTKSLHSLSPQATSEQSRDSNIHYTVSETVDTRSHHVTEEEMYTSQMQSELLQQKGALSLPPYEVQKELLRSYFRWLYPLQPILDKEQFLRDFEAGQVSILLLQALLSVAITCCNDDVIQKYWHSRRAAQALFHKRARALYDADFESNRVTVVQALFFMAFWWGSPTDIKDFSHWLSSSIHMAQAIGMHRSTKHSSLPTSERRLWKRIWWSLYVRDHFDAASLGRPMMINDDDCDIEALRQTDFEVAGSDEEDSIAIEHCIEITKLAVLIGRIVRAASPSTRQPGSTEDIDRDLAAWEKQLPELLRSWETEPKAEKKLFSATVFLGLHFCKIFLHRKSFSQTNSGSRSSSSASASANAVTHIVEELLADGLLVCAQVHLIAVIFASVTVHIASLEQSGGSRRKVIQHKAQLCLLGLAEFRSIWPFVDWMYRMFSIILERLRNELGPDTVQNNNFSHEHGQAMSQLPSVPQSLPQSDVHILPGEGTTMASNSFAQNQIWMNEAPNPLAFNNYNMFTMPSSENFLNPFMPLDAISWADQNMSYFDGPDAPTSMWPNAP